MTDPNSQTAQPEPLSSSSRIALGFVRARWFELVQTIGIVASIASAVFVLKDAREGRRIDNLLKINEAHRAIWTEILHSPALFRVMKADADIEKQPITNEERTVVVLLVLHLSTAFEASKQDDVVPIEGMSRDVRTFFSLPIPKAVWSDLRLYQNKDFVTYIESKFDEKTPIWR